MKGGYLPWLSVVVSPPLNGGAEMTERRPQAENGKQGGEGRGVAMNDKKTTTKKPLIRKRRKFKNL